MDIEAIMAREEAATGAPWYAHTVDGIATNPSGLWIINGPKMGYIGKSTAYGADDAAFIVHARQDIPDLLNELTRVNAVNAKLVEALAYDLDEVAYYIGNPSAWDSYSENVSEVLRGIVERARAALKLAGE